MRALNRLYRINFKSANIIPLSSQDPLFSASLPNHLALSSCTSGSASGDPVRVYKLYLFTCLLNSPKYKISSLFCFDKWDTIIDEVAHNLTLQCWKGCKAFSSPDNRFCPWIPLSTAPADSQYRFVLPRLPYPSFYCATATLSAVYAVVVCLSVCVCVCLSHSGIVSKRLNVGSRKQRRTIAR